VSVQEYMMTRRRRRWWWRQWQRCNDDDVDAVDNDDGANLLQLHGRKFLGVV